MNFLKLSSIVSHALLNSVAAITSRYAFFSNTVIKWSPLMNITIGLSLILGVVLTCLADVWTSSTLSPLEATFGKAVRISDLALPAGPTAGLYCWYALLVLIIIAFFTALPFKSSGNRSVGWTSSSTVDFLILVFFSFVFGFVILRSVNFLSFYSAVEGLSLATFFGISRHRLQTGAKEFFLKYFCMSSFSSVLLAAAISTLYLVTQTLDFGAIKLFLFVHKQSLWSESGYFSTTLNPISFLLYVSFSLIIVSFLFKLGAFPFHFLVPELYEATPLVFVVFYNFVLKFIYLFTMYILVLLLFSDWAFVTAPILLVSGIGSLIVGSLAALIQSNVWRLFGYASIAQTGLILLGFAKVQQLAALAATSFFFGYLLASLGLFLIILTISITTTMTSSITGVRFYSIAALAENFTQLKRYYGLFMLTLLAFVSAVCSFAALPPFIGFITKYMLLVHFVSTDSLYVVSLVVILNLLSTYYYLRLVERSTHSLRKVLFAQVATASPVTSLWTFSHQFIDYGRTRYTETTLLTHNCLYLTILCFCLLFIFSPLFLNEFVLTLSQALLSFAF